MTNLEGGGGEIKVPPSPSTLPTRAVGIGLAFFGMFLMIALDWASKGTGYFIISGLLISGGLSMAFRKLF